MNRGQYQLFAAFLVVAVCSTAYFSALKSVIPVAQLPEVQPHYQSTMAQEVKEFSNSQAAVLGAFAADAYGLSYEWVYDVSLIPKDLPKGLDGPHSQFLKAKEKGDFTMYGDQLLALLRSVVAKKNLDLTDYLAKYQQVFNPEYKGWLTGATKAVLGGLKEGKPLTELGQAGHDDTNPAGGNAPLLLVSKTVEEFVAAAHTQAAVTHTSPNVLKATDFFSHVLWEVAHGKAPTAAIKETANLPAFASDKWIAQSVHKGLGSPHQDTTAFIKEHGASCAMNGGFINAVHVINKYENDFQGAIGANTAAGGDSTGRGVIIGSVLGAHLGAAAIPSYIQEAKAYPEIVKLLQS